MLEWSKFVAEFSKREMATLVVAAYAAIVATLNFAWPRFKEWKDDRKAIFRALQGEKEAIADVATQVLDGKFNSKLRRSKSFQKRLIKALSMAFVLESSDRAKAYVVAALEFLSNTPEYKAEIITQLRAIELIYASYNVIVPDKSFLEKRLGKLCLVISHLARSEADA